VSGGILGRLRRLVGEPADDLTPGPFPNGKGSESESAGRIRLVVGLGNPGSEYAGNRHNVGAWTANRLARKHGIELASAGRAWLGVGQMAGREVAIARPRTFVNESGPAVWALIKRLKIDDAAELLVVHDELDLPSGKIRLRPHGGSGGYKGLKSIIDAVHSDRFPRLRIGIGRPVVNGEPTWEPEHVANYVLSDPPPAERQVLDDAVARAIEAIELAIAEGVEAAMQKYN
jgi:PTH1 family peptidyl-tRNA hydrolase